MKTTPARLCIIVMPISLALLPSPAVEFLAERLHRLCRKYHLHQQIEVFAEAEGQVQVRVLLLPLDVADSLEIDADDTGRFLPGEAPFLARHTEHQQINQ